MTSSSLEVHWYDSAHDALPVAARQSTRLEVLDGCHFVLAVQGLPECFVHAAFVVHATQSLPSTAKMLCCSRIVGRYYLWHNKNGTWRTLRGSLSSPAASVNHHVEGLRTKLQCTIVLAICIAQRHGVSIIYTL